MDIVSESFFIPAPEFSVPPGTNGLWIIGGGGAKRKNFDCARGTVYSPLGSELFLKWVGPQP